ncbi:MAG: hypothetical protein K2M44_01320 [Clostridia bacterium]|nr:hypothetical protein [Clostridia bacterium]
MGLGIQFKAKRRCIFIKTYGGGILALVMLVAVILLSILVDYSALRAIEVGCVIIADIAMLIIGIAMIKLLLSGLNDVYFNGKVALVVYDDSLQILIREKKLFKAAFVTVAFKDIANFRVLRAKGKGLLDRCAKINAAMMGLSNSRQAVAMTIFPYQSMNV